MLLIGFVGAQFAIMSLGLLPPRMWRSPVDTTSQSPSPSHPS
jgi:hypothetical protein